MTPWRCWAMRFPAFVFIMSCMHRPAHHPLISLVCCAAATLHMQAAAQTQKFF